MSYIPKNLGEMIEKDLAGFQLVKGYFLELEHGLMGFFPAIIASSEKIVVCSDILLLKKVWELLPKRPAKLREVLLLADVEQRFGFDVQSQYREKAEPVHILSTGEFSELSQKPDSFKWSPGLLSLKKEFDVRSPFEQT